MAANRGRVPQEGGFSLPELLVAMLLLSILSAIVLTMYSTVTTTFTKESAATDSTNVAAIAMNEVTRVIRAGTENPVAGQTLNAPVFLAAGPESVILHAFLDTDSLSPKPVKVQFSINADRELMETRWASYDLGSGYWAFNATAESERRIARQVAAPAGSEAKLFTFYDDQQVQLVPGPTGLTATQIRGVVSVEVNMKIQADITARAEPVLLQNRVGLPNLGISRVGQ